MCEKNHCSRTPEDLCTCMDWQNGDLIRTVTHFAENITSVTILFITVLILIL